jgi:hypothetical protein
MTAPDDDAAWISLTRRVARSVQTTVGWIFWDPGAVERYEALGVPAPIGYIASRGAPLGAAGPDAMIAAFGTISPLGIRITFDQVRTPERFRMFWAARDEAVADGLHRYAPDIVEPLVDAGPALWAVIEQLPRIGRVFFGAVLAMGRPADPLLSGWHAVNCLREWRGDTHWALVVASGLSSPEASILHNAWLGYEADWLPRSRGTSPDEIDAGWERLESKGLAVGRTVTDDGLALRERIEGQTDAQTTVPWRLLGADATRSLAERLEPPCELLLARVDETAGPNYQPASRIRG